uniref:Cytochrome b6-f complex subunit 6 n=1 Tax=Mesotaenium endlicherianum TaxID=184485 RepID=A0A024B485_9VIRI|nr:subunit VI of cytochrome b6/f complex [Mesotaenium endlicherianum]AHZ11167.1 subunit VI of cytochrome b6/f complex [Mesotaenium endlicherianum]
MFTIISYFGLLFTALTLALLLFVGLSKIQLI